MRKSHMTNHLGYMKDMESKASDRQKALEEEKKAM
jgi:hypothetical protein